MNRRAGLLWLGAFVLLGCSKPKPPTLTPRSAQVASISPSGVELTLELFARNPNGFPLVGSQVNSSFELRDGTALGTASSADRFSIPAEGEATVLAQLRVRFSSLGALAPYALAAQAVPYRLRGSALLGGENLNVEVPFQIEGELTPAQVVAAGLRGASDLLQKP